MFKMRKMLQNLHFIMAFIILCFNTTNVTAQKKYSGSYSIQYMPNSSYYNWNKINGIAKYNYLESNEQRIYDGPFTFTTNQNINSGDFLPKIINLHCDSITINGSFSQGRKNGTWIIDGYQNNYYNKGRIHIELNYKNGMLNGPVLGYANLNSIELCAFSFSFTNGLLNGPFKVTSKQNNYNYSQLESIINFNMGLYDKICAISYYDNENKPFKLQREYNKGLLLADKLQDLSTGEFLINKVYNFDYTASFNDRAGFFSLLKDMSYESGDSAKFIGYYLTYNSEIFNQNKRDTITRAVSSNTRYSYAKNREEFLMEYSANELFEDIYVENRRYPFVDISWNDDRNTLTTINEDIFSVLNIVHLFPLGQDQIVIKPIKEPYIFLSHDIEDAYNSYRKKFLHLESIKKFKNDSIRFRSKIIDDFKTINYLNKGLSYHFNIYCFTSVYDDVQSFGDLQSELVNQFNRLKKINLQINDKQNSRFVSNDFKVKHDSTNAHLSEFQNKLNIFKEILTSRLDLHRSLIYTQSNPKFGTQIQKLLEIPGAFERFNADRKFLFKTYETSEEELNLVLNDIKLRKEVYLWIYNNNFKISPKKYTDIDEFILTMKEN
jgi:regulator of sigma D/antitoxin component YwqK of YwqJK toxin-antitoxin module